MAEFDVCVVGAGPAGAISALLLARAGLKVALIDRAALPRDKVCGDGITPRGARLLQQLGVLAPIQARAFGCRGVTLRGDDKTTFDIDLDVERHGPSRLLVLPRLQLDALLLEAACAAGARFFAGEKVIAVDDHADAAQVVVRSRQRGFSARLVLLATGAESQLLRAAGLLDDKPPLEHAARVYFEGVEGLTDRVTLFFDGIDMPGYGWVFPTSPTSANIGCGVFARHGPPQAQRLATLLATHPLLVRMLTHAHQVGPLRAYPLRTDFAVERVGAHRVLCLGEAAGLVNPITGEGIDYAFESACFAAHATQKALAAGRPQAALNDYRAQLKRRFELRFRLYRWIQRHCLAEGQTAEFLAAVEGSAALRRCVVNGLFGRARPRDYLDPRVLGPALVLATGKARRDRRRARAGLA